VVYNREINEVGEVKVSEERVGFSVSRNSSLEKLIQAYIAAGGNPLDISHFFIPDRTVVVEESPDGRVSTGDEFPYGGVAYPQTVEPNEPEGDFGVYSGGFVPVRKYVPARTGGRRDLDADAESFVNYIVAMRRPVRQEIRHKRNDLESKIIKLCDLSEQLRNEREEILAQAFGGLSTSDQGFNPDRFPQVLRVPRIAETIDEIFYARDDAGILDFNVTNTSELTKFETLLEDILPDEANTAL
jgi:hypothetical protein